MCIGGSKTPALPPVVPEAAQMPDTTAATAATGGSAAADRRRRAAATGQGASGTILTGPRGVTSSAATGVKTLLGQ